MSRKPKPLCDCGNLAIHHLIVKVGSGGNKFSLKKMELPLCERCYQVERGLRLTRPLALEPV